MVVEQLLAQAAGELDLQNRAAHRAGADPGAEAAAEAERAAAAAAGRAAEAAAALLAAAPALPRGRRRRRAGRALGLLRGRLLQQPERGRVGGARQARRLDPLVPLLVPPDVVDQVVPLAVVAARRLEHARLVRLVGVRHVDGVADAEGARRAGGGGGSVAGAVCCAGGGCAGHV